MIVGKWAHSNKKLTEIKFVFLAEVGMSFQLEMF